MQRIEHGMLLERLAHLRAKSAERQRPLGRGGKVAPLERREQELEHAQLETPHREIVDQLGGARILQLAAEAAIAEHGARLAALGEVGHRRGVEVEHVQEQAAGWRVRADVVGVGGEQGVQRVDPDRARAERRGPLGQVGEVGEVAHAPVALRADAVELRGHAPEPGPRRRPVATGGRHDQLQRAVYLRIAAHRHGQPVIALRQGGWQGHAPATIGGAVHLGGGDLGQLVGRQPALVHAAGLLGQRPVDGGPAETGRQGEGDFGRLGRCDDAHRRQHAPPRSRLGLAQAVGDLARAADRGAHGLEQGVLGRQRDLASLAEEVGVARIDAVELAESPDRLARAHEARGCNSHRTDHGGRRPARSSAGRSGWFANSTSSPTSSASVTGLTRSARLAISSSVLPSASVQATLSALSLRIVAVAGVAADAAETRHDHLMAHPL